MKKRICSCFVLMAFSILVGCGNNHHSEKLGTASEIISENKTENIPVIQVEGDRRVYRTLDELEQFSQIAVIGEFVNDTEQDLDYQYDKEFGKDILVNATSHNEIKVLKVLKGDVPEGNLKLSQRYGVENDPRQLVTFSEMTPMEKGDRWIFFLYYDEIYDTWWCAGDYTGRYPILTDSLKDLCKNAKKSNQDMQEAQKEARPEEFGVYEQGMINLQLYCDLISKYDCSIE